MATLSTEDTVRRMEGIHHVLASWYSSSCVDEAAVMTDIIRCTRAYWRLVAEAKAEDLVAFPEDLVAFPIVAPYIATWRTPSEGSSYSWGNFSGPLSALRQWFICLRDKLMRWRFLSSDTTLASRRERIECVPEVLVVLDDIRERLTGRRTTRQSCRQYMRNGTSYD